MSDFIKSGEWADGFNAQNEMLDEHSKTYNLEDHDWRPEKPWYKPVKDDWDVNPWLIRRGFPWR